MRVNLYVVRHGQTCSNSTGILQGHLDSSLTDLGKHGSIETGKALNHISFSEVYSSDLGRAKETLRLIGFESTKSDPRLRERDYGPYSGTPWTEFKKQNGYTGVLPGVETDEEIEIRWKNFLDEMLLYHLNANNESNNILIVTHGGMIRVITGHLIQHSPRPLGMNLKKCGVGNNSISLYEMDVEDGKVTNCEIIKIFCCKHLTKFKP